jgi:carbon storage regulator
MEIPARSVYIKWYRLRDSVRVHHDSNSSRFGLHVAYEIPSIVIDFSTHDARSIFASIDTRGGCSKSIGRRASMLILTRRPAETIYIGEEVTVTVLGVVGNQVRFGIEAPRSITIDRAEIHERKKRAALGNVAASTPNGSTPRAPASEHEEVNGNVADHPDQPLNETAPTLKLRR